MLLLTEELKCSIELTTKLGLRRRQTSWQSDKSLGKSIPSVPVNQRNEEVEFHKSLDKPYRSRAGAKWEVGGGAGMEPEFPWTHQGSGRGMSQWLWNISSRFQEKRLQSQGLQTPGGCGAAWKCQGNRAPELTVSVLPGYSAALHFSHNPTGSFHVHYFASLWEAVRSQLTHRGWVNWLCQLADLYFLGFTILCSLSNQKPWGLVHESRFSTTDLTARIWIWNSGNNLCTN